MPTKIMLIDASRVMWDEGTEHETIKDPSYSPEIQAEAFIRNAANEFEPHQLSFKVGRINDDYADEIALSAGQATEMKKKHNYKIWKEQNGNELTGAGNFVTAPCPPFCGTGRKVRSNVAKKKKTSSTKRNARKTSRKTSSSKVTKKNSKVTK